MFSTEESHGIEIITQEIKGGSSEKEGTQKLATSKEQEATTTLRWEGAKGQGLLRGQDHGKPLASQS